MKALDAVWYGIKLQTTRLKCTICVFKGTLANKFGYKLLISGSILILKI